MGLGPNYECVWHQLLVLVLVFMYSFLVFKVGEISLTRIYITLRSAPFSCVISHHQQLPQDLVQLECGNT